MLDRLVASRPERSRNGTYLSAAVAVLMHGSLVTAAVIATLPAPRSGPPHVVSLDGPIRYVPRAPAAGRRPAPLPPAVPWPDPDLTALRLPTPDAAGPSALPGFGDTWTLPASDSGGRWGDGSPGMFGPAAGPGTWAGAAHRASLVDEPPLLLTRPALEYPALLRGAGLEGRVILEVIIDSTGTPEPESLRVIEASHRGFIASAARVVLGARFRPGRMRGHAVRVLIRQPITFHLER